MRADYLLSNTYRRLEVHQRLDQLRTLAAKNQGVPADEVDITNAEAFMIQDGGYIDATRDEIITQLGSFDRYFDEALGLDASVVGELQNTLLK